MGTSDISRNIFNPSKHYSSVRMQQGRVMVDDDWNENERIRLDEQKKLHHHIIGDHGTPDDGFRIKPQVTNDSIDFDIQKGTYYIEGLRMALGEDETYHNQKNWLTLQNDDKNKLDALSERESRTDFVYLEAWQQTVTAVEDEELLEKALGGLDTTTRIRTMYRVKIIKDIKENEIDCNKQIKDIKDNWESRHNQILKVSFTDEDQKTDLCSPGVQGGYLGAENQAIRVQITGEKKFTWGFNNASPLYRFECKSISNDPQDNTLFVVLLKLLTIPKDEYHWPKAGQIVELLPRSSVLVNDQKIAEINGKLGRVKESFNPNTSELKLTVQDFEQGYFNEWDSENNIIIFKRPDYCFLRVWDRGDDLDSDPEIAFDSKDVIIGHTGLKIEISGVKHYTGDYWIIAARPNTPDKVVPWELEKKGLPPLGVKRYFAPLAFIKWTLESQDEISAVQGEIVHDCRKKFRPLTDLETCCTYAVGDGKRSFGDFNSIQDALDNLPDEEGGKICILPGEHFTNTTINRKKNIWIMGCDNHTIVRSKQPENNNILPIISIKNSDCIKITNLTLSAESGTAISLLDDVSQNDISLKPSHNISILNNEILAREYAVKIKVDNMEAGNNNITISDNHIGMSNSDDGKEAICCLADRVFIERNKIVVVPDKDPNDMMDPRPAEDPSALLCKQCIDSEELYKAEFHIKPALQAFFSYVDCIAPFSGKKKYYTYSGIQIDSGSENVLIRGNEIIGGKGNGITLGSHIDLISFSDLSKEKNVDIGEILVRAFEATATISDISIIQNIITNMGGDGIVSASISNLTTNDGERKNINFMKWIVDIGGIILLGKVEDLFINGNKIFRCAQQFLDNLLPENIGFGGISLGYCENVVISENCIEENGENYLKPTCGIYIAYGEKLEISHNRILNNGKWLAVSEKNIYSGIRGGIYIEFALINLENVENNTIYILTDGIPAVKIHDNIVTQPYGQSLFIKALGPISVLGNQLTTQNSDIEVNRSSIIASNIFIFNLGISRDFIMKSWRPDLSFSLGSIKSYESFLSSFTTEQTESIYNAITPLLYYPSGNVIFSNNQVILNLLSKYKDFSLCSQLIVSLDDILYGSNQSEISSFIDLIIVDVLLLGISLRTNNNRFQEGNTLIPISLLSFGILINTTIGNQATHCLFTGGNTNKRLANVVLYESGCAENFKLLQSLVRNDPVLTKDDS